MEKIEEALRTILRNQAAMQEDIAALNAKVDSIQLFLKNGTLNAEANAKSYSDEK